MAQGCKRAALIWHRRAGKDKTAINWMAHAAWNLKKGTYYYLFPTYAQGKKIVWDGMDRDGFPFIKHFPDELVESTNETEMQVRLKNGSVIQIIGTDRMDSIVGTNPVGVVLSEYSLQNPKAWQLVEPILLENGGWAVFVYTPRGKNHGYKLYDANHDNAQWYVSLLTIRETRRPDGSPLVTEEQIAEIRRNGTDEDLIQQEYYCSFAGAMSGSFYGKLIEQAYQENRIDSAKVTFEPALSVHTFWDIGVNDSNAIWFMQTVAREFRFIDYLEGSGEGLPYYIRELKNKPYVYGTHIGPHDLKVRDYTSGRARIDAARDLGVRFKLAPKLGVYEGIDIVRRHLPRCWFNGRTCERGLSALMQYHKERDDDHQEWKREPVHDWSSHGADAMRTGFVGWVQTTPDSQLLTRAQSEFDPLAMVETHGGPAYGRQTLADGDFDVFRSS
jgi:phage terminase large subunit